MVHDFDVLPRLDIQKPKVGIVGEILVKFIPMANNYLADLLESEGAEAVIPDLLDFFLYCFYNNNFKTDVLGFKKLPRQNQILVSGPSKNCVELRIKHWKKVNISHRRQIFTRLQKCRIHCISR